MDLTPYVEQLRAQLAVAAEAGGEEARALADRLTAPLESAIRLMLLEALSAAAEEITRDLAPGSVELRLRGRDPSFVVTAPPTFGDTVPTLPTVPAVPTVPATQAAPIDDDSSTARINFRLSEQLKARIEEAAGRDGVSVNAWLVRTATAAVTGGPPPTEPFRPADRPASSGQRFTGWVR
jgi:HicB family